MRQLKITKSITNRESESLEKYLQEIGKVELDRPEDTNDAHRSLLLQRLLDFSDLLQIFFKLCDSRLVMLFVILS